MQKHAGINFKSEELVALGKAGRVLPTGRNGKHVHIATLHRWASRGLKGVTLETIRIGGRTYTSIEALQRFFERLSGATSQAVEPKGAPNQVRVEAELERHGL